MAEFAKSIGQALTEITGGKSEKRSGFGPHNRLMNALVDWSYQRNPDHEKPASPLSPGRVEEGGARPQTELFVLCPWGEKGSSKTPTLIRHKGIL